MNLKDSYLHGTDLIALIRALKWDGGVLKYLSASTSTDWISVGIIPTWNQDTTGKAATAGTADKVKNSLTFTGGVTGTWDGSSAKTITIPTKSSWNYDDVYLKLAGGTMSNTNVVTNLNADLLDGHHVSSFYKHATASPFGNTTLPWHKIATFSQSTKSMQINTSIAFYISEFYSSKAYGIFTVRARAESNSSSITWLTVDFLVNAGILTSNIVATWKYIGDNNIVINVYAKRSGWGSFSFRKIEEQAWGMPTDGWITLKAHAGNEYCYASIPSDENQVVSTNLYIDNNAVSASQWKTARTITLTGSVTGSVSIDGSSNVTLSTTTNHTHTFDSLTSKPTTIEGYGITDALKIDGSNGTAAGVSALINKLDVGSSTPADTDYYVCQYAGGGITTTTYHRRPMSAMWNWIKAKTDTLYPTKTGSGASGTWGINVTGKAATAGTADLTKASLTFGSKTFNGSEAKTITLLDLGGAPAVNGGYLPLSGGTMTGTISLPNGTYISNGSTISGYGMLFWDGTNTNVGSTHGNTIIRNSTGDLKHKIGSNEYNILDSNNSSVSLNNSTLSVKINGITQSLTNTWRGILDNLTSTSATDSLSAKQGKLLNDKFANYLSLTGGTVTGATTFSQAINANILGNATTSDRVNNSLKIQLKGGTTEGTNQFTFDGSSAKTINITLASIGAQPAGSYKTIQTAVDIIGSSSNTLTFINSISLNTNGVITATTGVVRNASTSASGVVSTESQSFAGAKTFTANIKASAAAGTSNILEGNDLGASLIVKRTDGDNWSLITYLNTAGTLGYLGFNASKQPIYRTSSGTDYVLYHSGNNPNTDSKVRLTATDGTATDRYIPFPTTGTSISSGSTYELFYQADFKYNPGTKLLSVPNITLSNKLTASLAEIDSLTSGNLVVQGTSSLGTVTSGTWNGSKITNTYLNNSSISLAGRTITLGDTVTAATIKSDLSLNNVENKSSATIRGELTSSNVTTALGYTPYNSTNPNGYITSSANITGSAAYPTGFNSRSSSISWGTLTTGNGYTYLTNWHTNAGSDISFAEKSGVVSVQIDGKFYQNEGKYVVLDSSHAANNITSTKISNWDAVYNWYSATTDPSTDAKIDKWFEIENFLNGVTNALTLTEMLMLYVTLNTAQTITGAKTFSQAINADLLGTATQANRLSNAMTLELTGSVTGSVSFDGSGKATLNTTTNHTHSYLPLSGGTITGTLNINRDAAAIHYNSSSGVSQGWLGFSAADTPSVWMADGSTKYNLIHSGNIGSQSVSHATSANGIANSGTLDSQEKIDNFITANRFKYATFKTTDSNNLNFVSNDGMIFSIPWTSTDYGAQIAFDDTTAGTVKVRGKASTWGNWYTLLHSGNYNSYAPKLDGTGASGTWGINISGTAAHATSAGNANTLDNIDSTGFLRYYNSNTSPSNVNIVNTPSYVWTVSTTGGSVSTVTKPSGMDNAWGVIHLHTHVGNYATQLGFGGTTNRMYMRNAYDNSSFGSWQALAFTSDIPTKVSQLTNDAGYVTTDTTYSTATSDTLGLVKIGYTANGKNYPVQLSNGQMYVNVPWTDTNTTYNFSGTSFTSGNSSAGEHNANNITSNGHWYYTSNGPSTSIGASTNDGALYSQAYSDIWVAQIAQDYRNGRLFVRGKNNGTWLDWKRIAITGESQPANGGNADTVDNLHASAFTRSEYSGCSDSNNSMTTCTDLATWISRLGSTGIISGTSSISTGNWWWTRSVDFQVNNWNIRTSGAMIIHSGNGDSSDKNYKHFLVLDAYGDLYGITSNLNWEKYTKFVKTSDLPTKVSQFTNDAGYVTSSGVTNVATGTGLTGGTITSTGTISIDSTYLTYISHGESAYNSLGNYILKKPDNHFYNYIGYNYRSKWYKVTLPFHNTTSTNNRWMMISMELILKGNYQNTSDGTIYLSYYIYYPANNNVGIATNVYALAIGSNMNDVRIAYSKTDLGIFYVYVTNAYNSFAIQNLSANDSAISYDFTTITIDALTSSNYPEDDTILDVNIRKLYTTDGTSLMLNGNILIDAENIGSQSVSYADTTGSVAWSGVTNKPNFVNSFGTKTGNITIRGGQTGNGSVNLVMSNNELLASIVGLGSNAYTSTAYLPLAGGTMSGLLTTTFGNNHNGIKVGNTYINAINGELIFLNNSSIRFGGDSWDYNVWAGLKYVHSSKIIYLGLADGSAFIANTAQSGGKLYLPGIDNLYTGNGTNLIWHAGNDGSGSGLDADLLDGKHASAFATSDHNHDSIYVAIAGNQIIAGNKTFSGTTSLSIAEIDSLTTGNLVNQGSASLGTITSGIWNASTIAADYLPLGGTDSGTKRWVKKDATTGLLYIDLRNDIQTLPTGNKTYLTYIGALSSSNNNKSNGATTNGNTYMKIFEDNILKNQYKISGSGSVSVASDANGNITITGTTYTNNISTPDEAIAFTAANYNLSSASWTSATSLTSYSGTFAIQIKDTNSTTNKTNYYSGIIMLNGSTGRLAVEEIPLSALMATGSDTEVPTRIYAGIQLGVLKLSSQDASAVAHNITVKILKLIAL